MEDKKISNEESLELITRMISNARGNMRGGSFYFLTWGWIVVIGSVGQFLMSEFTSYEHPYIVWLIGIPGFIVTMVYGFRRSRRSNVYTYSDSIVFNTWMAFIPCILIIIAFGSYLDFQITALIMLMTGFATFISGTAISFKPLRFGGLLFFLLTPVALLVGVIYSPLVMTVAIVGGYLIPGYMLKNN